MAFNETSTAAGRLYLADIASVDAFAPAPAERDDPTAQRTAVDR